MSWTADIWSQNSNYNLGYPYNTIAGYTNQYNGSNGTTVWKYDSTLNLGYPYTHITTAYTGVNGTTIFMLNSEHNMGYPYNETTDEYDGTNGTTIWNLRSDINLGYPYIKAVFGYSNVPEYTAPDLIRFISVIDPPVKPPIIINGYSIRMTSINTHDEESTTCEIP